MAENVWKDRFGQKNDPNAQFYVLCYTYNINVSPGWSRDGGITPQSYKFLF